MLKSKIHRATVTDTNVDYEGSLSIDADLLDAADILPNEQIHVWDVTNGQRLTTYALAGERGSGVMQVNGGGAHLVKKGDLVIIATFTELKTKDAKKYKPVVVFVDDQNKPTVTAPPVDSLPTPAETNGSPDFPARQKKPRKKAGKPAQ
jgi:aspartate 1-decarboxylase